MDLYEIWRVAWILPMDEHIIFIFILFSYLNMYNQSDLD